MPGLRGRERALRDVRRTRRLLIPRAVAARVRYAIVLYAAGVALLGGAVILTVLWSVLLGPLALVLGLAATGCLISDVFEDAPMVCRAFAACALIAAAVTAVALSFTLNEQALRDRGIVERAIVVAEHYQCINTDNGDCLADYSYTLRSMAGPLIRPDLDNGSTRLAIGSHLTVLADPLGRVGPSTNTHLSFGSSGVTAMAAGGVAAACLLVAASTAPRPSRRH